MPTGAAKAILLGGLLAGTLDISAAIGVYALRGVAPIRILQSVASGLLGRESYQGGAATALLGLGLHFTIATTAAAVYWMISRRFLLARRRPVLAGALFGIGVYLFMNFVVVPLSAIGWRAPQPSMVLIMVAIHIACVGWPIAFAAGRFGTKD